MTVIHVILEDCMGDSIVCHIVLLFVVGGYCLCMYVVLEHFQCNCLVSANAAGFVVLS